MEPRRPLMEVPEAERKQYFSSLRSAYGPEILAGESGLQTAFQRSCEAQRHRLNERAWTGARQTGLMPRRLLVSVTQRCPFSCSHCWVFGSPAADSTLSLADLEAIHQHTAQGQPPRWTVSGGEFFSLAHFDQALARFPIDCAFSNGFWGLPSGRCRRLAARIAAALDRNPYLGGGVFTLILSYDSYHAEAGGAGLALAGAIANIAAELYQTLPQVQLRISHARRSPQDDTYAEVLRALEQQGFSTAQTARLDHNGNIATLSYRYARPAGPPRELFVDTYPIAPVCRALLQPPEVGAPAPGAPPSGGPGSAAAPRTRYEYTVGPDGGVGLYQVLYAPPVPYCLGDLAREPWSAIAARAAGDPIALTLENEGTALILSFLKRYAPALLDALNPAAQMVQQFLYLVLLDPERRLLLNAFLLQHLHQARRLEYLDPALPGLLQAALETPAGASRQSSLAALYGWPAPETRP